MPTIKLYDRQGRFVAILNVTEQHSKLHHKDGQFLADIGEMGSVFTCDGRHVGWLLRRQIYDRDGRLVLAGHAIATGVIDISANDVHPELSMSARRCKSNAQRETIGSLPGFKDDAWAKVNGFGLLQSKGRQRRWRG